MLMKLTPGLNSESKMKTKILFDQAYLFNVRLAIGVGVGVGKYLFLNNIFE
jgi:hypothetical protein